jgi:hypothetical protein
MLVTQDPLLMLAVELHLTRTQATRRYCEALQSRGMLAKDSHDDDACCSSYLWY